MKESTGHSDKKAPSGRKAVQVRDRALQKNPMAGRNLDPNHKARQPRRGKRSALGRLASKKREGTPGGPARRPAMSTGLRVLPL
jgi:hypothetical protein